jgi:hypothetical protein
MQMIRKEMLLQVVVLFTGFLVYTFFESNIVIANFCLSDVNNDGKVNGKDMDILDSEMGRNDCYSLPCQADFNGDGMVDIKDKEILQSEFGRYNCLSGKEDVFEENLPTQELLFDERDDYKSDDMIESKEVDKKGDSDVALSLKGTRFQNNKDGTVTDLKTGLMWTKDANLPGDTMLFYKAPNYIKGMNEGKYPNFGYTDWRLPNLSELQSLIDFTKITTWGHVLPASQPFTNVQSLAFNRGSTVSYLYTSAHSEVISLYCRLVGHNVKSCYGYVWPVRTAQ